MAKSGTDFDPLMAGFFSITEAARLVGVNPRVVRSWLNGYSNSNAGPVIDRDFDDPRTVSFLDLMELRFIAVFRSQSVSMPTLRLAAEKARQAWGVHHPLALSSEKYVTDRRTIFATVAKENKDRVAWDMASGQLEMWETIEHTIEKGVEFDPQTYLAKVWHPRLATSPNVVIDPRVAFGKPIVRGTTVPTVVLFRQWRADKNKARVADWFDVPIDAVTSAIEYELVAA